MFNTTGGADIPGDIVIDQIEISSSVHFCYTSYTSHALLFQVVFHATRGADIRGDIAIDQIEIRSGACQGMTKYLICLIHVTYGSIHFSIPFSKSE